MTTHSAKAGIFSRRLLAVAATAGITLSLALTMGVALANDLHQADQLPISWDSQGFPPSAGDCDNVQPGEVLWHFIHTKTNGGDLPSTLTAEFDTAGVVTANGFSNGGGSGVVQYDIITGHDTLLSASDSIQNDGLLNLSHICSGGEEQSVAESVSESVSESVAESASGEQSVEAGTGTPAESTPDGALPFGGSSPLPMIAFSLILLTSLGSLAYANVKAVRKN